METNNLTEKFNAPTADSPPPVPLARAMEIFDQVADTEEIAFGYADDGCYARAHLMCRQLQQMGLTPKKAWAFEGKPNYLSVEIAGRKHRWWFHMAPTLTVQMQDGAVEDMVFDPGLFDGPVSLKEWGEIMKAPPEKIQITAFDAPPAGYKGAYAPNDEISSDSDEKAKKTMTEYLKFQSTEPRKVFVSQSRQQISQTQNIQSRIQGKTWVTVSADSMKATPVKKNPESGWCDY